MKKLSALLIAISFCILSAGNVLANESQVDPIDRHSVWSNWFDEKGNRLPDTIDKMKSGRETPQKVSTEANMATGRDKKSGSFNFIQETKSYDHSRDKGQST